MAPRAVIYHALIVGKVHVFADLFEFIHGGYSVAAGTTYSMRSTGSFRRSIASRISAAYSCSRKPIVVSSGTATSNFPEPETVLTWAVSRIQLEYASRVSLWRKNARICDHRLPEFSSS